MEFKVKKKIESDNYGFLFGVQFLSFEERERELSFSPKGHTII